MVQIEDVKIPILLPKRGRGHQEVLASFSISTLTSINPFEFIPFITSLACKTCTVSDVVDLSRSLMKALSLHDINIRTTFLYALDRVSPSLATTFFSLPCFYERKVVLHELNTASIGVTVPIQVELVIPLSSSLILQIEKPGKIFFEDIIDHIYKVLGASLQPVISDTDAAILLGSQEPCHTPGECLSILKNAFREKKFGKGGTASIEIFDLYQAHKLTYSKSWKGNV